MLLLDYLLLHEHLLLHNSHVHGHLLLHVLLHLLLHLLLHQHLLLHVHGHLLLHSRGHQVRHHHIRRRRRQLARRRRLGYPTRGEGGEQFIRRAPARLQPRTRSRTRTRIDSRPTRLLWRRSGVLEEKIFELLPAFCGGGCTRGVGSRPCFERLLYRCALAL